MHIRPSEYSDRREKLAAEMEPGSIAIIPAGSEILRNGDNHYPFRQDSRFYYLSGFEEPDALLVITADSPSQSILFNRPKDPAKEQWEGRRLGQRDAPEKLGVTEAYPIDEAESQLEALLRDRSTVYFPTDEYPQWEKRINSTISALKRQIRRGITAPNTRKDIEPLISEMRLIKSPAEIALMREAAAISANAHKAAMRACTKAENERELDAILQYEFYRKGCKSVAYPPIVGSGANACVLHYTKNNQPLRDGDMVLIDAGGEYQNYAADISRSFPVNGQFSTEQRQIYELVLKSQRAGIACIEPGVAWNHVQDTIVRILTEGLCNLGILKGEISDLIETAAYRPFYMHNSGHWLGLDVHDCGQYKRDGAWRPLEAGMVLTVEPGLYLAESIPDLNKRWHNIGVRIEDDILVTETGHENLSADVPVEIADIEALMRD